MNMIVCGECCRWQKDGLCTLTDLSRGVNGKSADCRYFEKAEEQGFSKNRDTSRFS